MRTTNAPIWASLLSLTPSSQSRSGESERRPKIGSAQGRSCRLANVLGTSASSPTPEESQRRGERRDGPEADLLELADLCRPGVD